MEVHQQGSENNSNDPMFSLEKAPNKNISLEKIYRWISLDIPLPKDFDNSGALFIGRTKEGKTSLMTYLEGVPLKAVPEETGCQKRQALASEDSSNDHGIDGGFQSRTIIPTNFENYWDLPGIAGDTRGTVQDIINSWSIRRLCSLRFERIKIVIVISEESLGDYLKVLDTLKVIGEIFPEIGEKAPISSLCMVITKKQNCEIARVRRMFTRMLKEQREKFDKKKAKILEYFSNEESPIACFDRPMKEGLISSDQKLAITKTIQNTTWYENPKISLGVSEESKNVLLKLEERELDDLSRSLRENAARILSRFVKKTLDLGNGTAKDFKVILKSLEAKLADLSEHKSPLKVQVALDLLEKVNENLNDDELKNFLFKKREHFNFFAQFDQDLLSRDVIDRLSFLSSIRKDLSNLREKPLLGKVDKLITLQGRVISSSDINDAVSKNLTVSEIDVYASVAVFLDDTIKASGVTLCIMSSLVKVVGAPLINLSGKEGEGHEKSRAENGKNSQEIIEGEAGEMRSIAVCGNPGLPGKPGQNGGSFIVKVKNILNAENLSVMVNGGRGGPGQDGGDGADGADGRADLALKKVQDRDITARSKKKLFECETFGDVAETVVKAVFTFNSKFTLRYQRFERGQKGGTGGRGGVGGCGGKPGDINIEGANPGQTFQEDGAYGPNGKAGRPGLGGWNSPIYAGVYVVEEVLSSLRGERDIGADSAMDVVGSGALMTGASTASSEVIRAIASKTIAASILSSKIALITIAAPLATGIATTLAIKALSSFISKALTKGWLVEPHQLDNMPSRGSNGEIPRKLNFRERKDSNQVLRINSDEKIEKYNKVLKKEENTFAQRLISNAHSLDFC